MWLEPSTIGGAILLAIVIASFAGMAVCAGCDREYLGLDDETLP